MRRGDLIAGLSVAGLLLPQAVAYAGIAGLEPQHAIFATIAGALAYALVGRSRFAIVAPTSSSAAILAAVLASLPADGAAKVLATTALAGFTGLAFLAAAAARLGALTGFISPPVLRGFAFGLALTIIVGQLPLLVGHPVGPGGIAHVLAQLAAAPAQWNPASVATGLAALAALLALRRWPMIPAAFLVLAGGIAAARAFGLSGHGVAVVGAIDAVPSWPQWPQLSWAQASDLGRLTLPLVLILFAESWGTIRSLALHNGDRVEAARELAALGVANLASALAQGMPVGAGFSAGAAGEAAGARTRATGVVAAIGLALLIGFGGSLVADLPEPVLAAVVIAALTHSLDPAPLLRLWRLDRDQYVAIGAAAAVLLLGVLNGMLVAVGLSLLAVMQRLASPLVLRLGRLGDGHDYVDLARHADAVAPPGIAIWRPAEPLFFANADRVLALIAAGSRAPEIRAVVVSLEESFDLDSTAADALIAFDRSVTAAGLRVQLARVHDRARDLLLAAGAETLPARCSYSVDDAVRAVSAAVSMRG